MTPDLDALEQAAREANDQNPDGWSDIRRALGSPAAILALIARVRAAEAALGEAREHVERLLIKAVRDEHGIKTAWALSSEWQWPNDAPAVVHETLEEARAWLAKNPRKESV